MRCIKCGKGDVDGSKLELPGVRFNNLEGSPTICDRCFSEIFRTKGERSEEVKEWLVCKK